jgi:Glyoxalase-like domain
MIRAAIDHLVVTAPSLAAGIEFMHDALGVTAQPGGRHPRMGTHNALVKFDDTTYLEVLAVDPAARPPGHPRWFGLDDLDGHSAPALAAWVARVEDIHAALVAMGVTGDVKTMSRGSLEWLIAIPADGQLSAAGVMPALIQWLHEAHPAPQLEGSGCTLESLRGLHADGSQIARPMGKVHFDPRWSLAPATVEDKPGLVATIQTPRGAQTLVTRGRA